MTQAIEFQKLMTEIVFINPPGPEEPTPGMSGGELLHGFLAELYRAPNPEVKVYVMDLCSKMECPLSRTKGYLIVAWQVLAVYQGTTKE